MRTIFVEDTESHRRTIRQMLSDCPPVELVGEADSLDTGYELIKSLKPDLVLFDVELYPGTAFDLLNRLLAEGKISFEIIFLTGFVNFEYPVRAIHYAALDFLTKPIEKEKLKEAIERAAQKIAEKQAPTQYQEQIALFLQSLKTTPERRSNRIAFHRTGGAIEFVNVSDIVYCEADKDTTHVFLNGGRKFTATRNLAFYAKPLEIDFNFFRISDKQLANLEYLKSYEHAKDFQLTLTNGVKLYAARRGGQALKQHIADTFGNDAKTAPVVEPGLLKGILKKLMG